MPKLDHREECPSVLGEGEGAGVAGAPQERLPAPITSEPADGMRRRERRLPDRSRPAHILQKKKKLIHINERI